MKTAEHPFAFFRQSGWMGLATGVGGVFMSLVHVPAARMPPAEYGVLLMFLQVINLMLIPAMGLQTVVAQQAAAAITPDLQRELAHTVRRLFLAMFIVWICVAVGALAGQKWLLATLKIGNPLALWVTLLVGLASLWYPILQGILQGRQNFLWLGWLQVINGLTRFMAVLLIVWWLGGYAAGALGAVIGAYVVVLATAAWHGRSTWLGEGRPVAWKGWLRRVVPLTLGLAASQFMMAADQIVVQTVFDREVTARYGAAGMIGRALVFITAALVAVMFPKIVRSVARSEKTDVAALALGATAVVGGVAGVVCTLFPTLPLRIMYYFQPHYWASAPLVPWFVWSMLPLTLANVLINNLLARGRFACVPWLLLVAVGYGAALTLRAQTLDGVEMFAAFTRVVQTIGMFSLLLLAVAGFFTWLQRSPDAGPAGTVSGTAPPAQG